MFLQNLKKLATGSPLYAVAGLCFFMGFVLAGFMGAKTANNLVLMEVGQRTEGRVTRVISKLISEGGGASVYVDFAVDGRKYSGMRHSLSSSWRQGETLTVIHYPNNPGRFILEQEIRMSAHWKQNIGMTLVGLVLLLAGAKGALRWMGRARDLGILQKRGKSYPGKIMEVKNRNYRMGNHTPVFIEYSFIGLLGREYRGASENLPSRVSESIGLGLRFSVLQDPLKPSRHMADVWSM